MTLTAWDATTLASIPARIDSLGLSMLKNRLGDCSHMAKKEFSAIETQNIIKYLNDQFYHFRWACRVTVENVMRRRMSATGGKAGR
jgi:hypothetical protein